MPQKMRFHRLAVFICLSLLVAPACRLADPPAPPAPGEERNGKDRGGPKDSSIDALGPVGSAARQLLRPQPFTEIVIEVAFVNGREPKSATLDHLTDEIGRAAQKTVTIDTHEIPGGRGSYSSQDIRNLSGSRRNKTSAPKASVFLAFLDGRFAEDDQALGVAVAATVAAVFPDRIGSLSNLLQPGGVEQAVATHELGHILALVNIGYESASDREDPEHPNHSSNKSSVMYWAVETLSVADVFSGGPPDRFDEADIADLRMLAGTS
ncbi:MAG: hypothetical protein KY429_09770 [Actinobacteria bacterium]|nr:hypothetical protein [Actinomycetota bacterium]